MKITKDGKGKHIIDFEGLEIRTDIDCAANELFNPETVSEVHKGHWVFPSETEDDED